MNIQDIARRCGDQHAHIRYKHSCDGQAEHIEIACEAGGDTVEITRDGKAVGFGDIGGISDRFSGPRVIKYVVHIAHGIIHMQNALHEISVPVVIARRRLYGLAVLENVKTLWAGASHASGLHIGDLTLADSTIASRVTRIKIWRRGNQSSRKILGM